MSRTRETLNGEWDFYPLADNSMPETAPANARWERQKLRVPSSWRWGWRSNAGTELYDLFGYPADWNASQAGWIRRTFQVKPEAGKRTWLRFEAVLQRSVYFLNGQRIYASTESYLPVEFDISEVARAGENELLVWIGPYETVETPQGAKVLAPCGSWFASMARGPWQDVWLETIPAVSISDAAVRTSVRRGEVEVEITLENRTQAAFEGTLSLAVAGGPVFAPQAVELALGVMSTLRLRAPWADARLWSPEDPHLYTLEVRLEQDGRLVDTRPVRFGFREVWLDGHCFMLNGKRINLRGDAWHYQGFAMQTRTYAANWYRMCKDAGVNFVRLHAMPYPEFFLDAADEMGMLVIAESAIYGSGKGMQADHPTFLGNCHDHLRAMVRRDRSHPSIIIWSMQNEMRWTDGREGYRAAMPELTETMKALDPTRPVSYDGDNRLFPPEQSDIVSMHYNIDGTVASWDRKKPLIFGEHGAFHYVSPQVAARYGGPAAYLSFDEAMRALARSERLFIQYARREEVTGVTPFNLVNYTLRAQPARKARLLQGGPRAAGIHPLYLPEGSLTIDNGMAPGPLVYVPTPAWRVLQNAFRPVTMMPDELDTQFYGASVLERHFSVYNDTLRDREVSLNWRWILGEGSQEQSLGAGKIEFSQAAGERQPWAARIALPAVEKATPLTLSLVLLHDGARAHATQITYRVYPNPTAPLDEAARAAYLGDDVVFAMVRAALPRARRIAGLEGGELAQTDLLVVGPGCGLRFEQVQPVLDAFVRAGGSLLLLEQERFLPGGLTFSDRSFPMVFANEAAHPVLNGLSDADLRYWNPTNPWEPEASGMTHGALVKPAGGDIRVILECGDGDFGWGGLLWTPLVEFALGKGRVICCQMALSEYAGRVPAARALLRNLLSYGSRAATSARRAQKALTLMVFDNQSALEFLAGVGAVGEMPARPGGIVVLDPEKLDPERQDALRLFLLLGGQALVLPAKPEHAAALSALAGMDVTIEDAPAYQLTAGQHELAAGVSAFDLYHLERVTYSPANQINRPLALHSLEVGKIPHLFESAHTPWESFFVHGRDGEFEKIAVATKSLREPFIPRGYGAVAPVGAGRLVFCQILPAAGNAKSARVYARLLSNLGAGLETELFNAARKVEDDGIDVMMALPRAEYQDAAAMEAYFSAADYTLNNLGEGVYGWMKRIERVDGAMVIPESAGRTWFLSVFVLSDLNRDPQRRAAGELPDSSIVPDLFLELNCAGRVYVNGRRVYAAETASGGAVRIEDVALLEGVNRLALVCQAGDEDVRLRAWFVNKYGDPPEGLHYRLTLD